MSTIIYNKNYCHQIYFYLNYTDQSVYIMNKDLKDIRKEQIMNAAQAVVVSKGYDQSRMDDIVEKPNYLKGLSTGITNQKKTSIYH